jgi:hypothetical protein
MKYTSSGDYVLWLERLDFNEAQIDFLITQREIYLNSKDTEEFDYDSYERDMWYTMNRSGLFEDEPENKTEITDWTPTETRQYITEVNL